MPSPFEAAGARLDATKSAPLHTNRFFTGLWTQRSPLRDAATPFLHEKFYSASRYDSLIGGANTEITTRLTLARRPGSSVYVSTYSGNSLPEIDRLYEWRSFIDGKEYIRVMGDSAGGVFEVTSATESTNGVAWTKQPGAGASFFQSVGNTLFWADGISAKQWIASPIAWGPNKQIAAGAFLIDNHGAIESTVAGGTTGGTVPAWAGGSGLTTTDGSVTWVSKGFQVQNWGIAPPLGTPTLSQLQASSTTNTWKPNMYWLGGTGAVHDTPTDTIQKLIVGGIPASTAPAFASIVGQTTNDGAAQWRCLGPATWRPNTAYAVGALLLGYFDYTAGDALIYKCTNAGVSGPTQPVWPQSAGSMVQDNSVSWQYTTSVIETSNNYLRHGLNGVTPALSSAPGILDSKGGYQQIAGTGPNTYQGTGPNWPETLGQFTIDGEMLWQCATLPANVTAPWNYVYAFRNSITGQISTASPAGLQIVPSAGNVIVVVGLGSPDPQVDIIRIYRTAQGESTFLFLADIAAPPPGNSWSYQDSSPDNVLNPFIQAQINLSNNPPPPTLAGISYNEGRLWGFDGNVLRYSAGPDTLSGNGNECWPPGKSFTLASKGILTWPTSIGLIAFTQSDVYIVIGSGTAASPFRCVIFQQGVGLLNYDAFAVNGSTAYLMTTAQRCISFDPGAGETEIGFPIGDLLEASYTAAGTRMAYHEGSSADTALYLADGTVGWYRLSTISAPEQGQVWSPQAQFAHGISAIASIEIAPGVKRLLYALKGGGPILMRDAAGSTDNGALYPATAEIGSVVLAQPGQIAGAEFFTLDTTMAGSQATLGLRFGEIGGPWTSFTRTRQDPTLLPPAATLRGDRYYMGQQGTTAWCRHLQIKFSWPAENAANELLAYTLFGQIKQERPEN